MFPLKVFSEKVSPWMQVSQADVKLFFESLCGEVSLHGMPYLCTCLKISCCDVLSVRRSLKENFYG